MFYKWLAEVADKWDSAGFFAQLCSMGTAVGVYLVGKDGNAMVESALMFMATDITLGVLAALYRGDFSSKEMRKGLIRKMAFIIAIVLSHTVDVWLGTGINIKRFVCSSISGYEFLSNVETLATMKIKVFPTWLIKRFKNVTQDEMTNALDKIRETIEAQGSEDKDKHNGQGGEG